MGEMYSPNDCMGFSGSDYNITREDWNRTCKAFFQESPNPSMPAEIDWTPIWSLTQGVKCYPSLLLLRIPNRKNPTLLGGLNSAAAGNTKEQFTGLWN